MIIYRQKTSKNRHSKVHISQRRRHVSVGGSQRKHFLIACELVYVYLYADATDFLSLYLLKGKLTVTKRIVNNCNYGLRKPKVPNKNSDCDDNIINR